MRGGRLLACWTAGRAGGEGFLDDYAFLIDALLELGGERLTVAEALAQTMLDSFEDADNGGFFFTSPSHERLIHRPSARFSDDAASFQAQAVAGRRQRCCGWRRSRRACATQRRRSEPSGPPGNS